MGHRPGNPQRKSSSVFPPERRRLPCRGRIFWNAPGLAQQRTEALPEAYDENIPIAFLGFRHDNRQKSCSDGLARMRTSVSSSPGPRRRYTSVPFEIIRPIPQGRSLLHLSWERSPPVLRIGSDQGVIQR